MSKLLHLVLVIIAVLIALALLPSIVLSLGKIPLWMLEGLKQSRPVSLYLLASCISLLICSYIYLSVIKEPKKELKYPAMVGLGGSFFLAFATGFMSDPSVQGDLPAAATNQGQFAINLQDSMAGMVKFLIEIGPGMFLIIAIVYTLLVVVPHINEKIKKII